LEMIPECSGEAMESLIQAVYRQILGNAYVMESERTIPQSQFKLGQLSVRECFWRKLLRWTLTVSSSTVSSSGQMCWRERNIFTAYLDSG
jgi:hypothetical protein